MNDVWIKILECIGALCLGIIMGDIFFKIFMFPFKKKDFCFTVPSDYPGWTTTNIPATKPEDLISRKEKFKKEAEQFKLLSKKYQLPMEEIFIKKLFYLSIYRPRRFEINEFYLSEEVFTTPIARLREILDGGG